MQTGLKQSPINIDADSAIQAPAPPLIWSKHYAVKPDSLILEIGSSSIRIIPGFKANAKATIMGGPLKQPYELDHFHFHWGISNEEGSEHSINGKYYSVELHAVHFKAKLTCEEASDDPQGIAVVAYFIHLNNSRKESIQRFCEVVKLIERATSQGMIRLTKLFPLSDIIRPFTSQYYYYYGSMTSEPYNENVTWIISPEVLQIPEETLTSFRKITESNKREIQNLCNRKVNYVTETCSCPYYCVFFIRPYLYHKHTNMLSLPNRIASI